LRISACEGLNTESAAEIEGGSVKRLIGGGGPKIQLVSGTLAVEAPKEISRDVN
jgi:hypothetical protein